MGNTKRNFNNKYDDEDFRSNKRAKHASNKKGQGMRVLNTYDEDDDDFDYEEYDVIVPVKYSKHTH